VSNFILLSSVIKAFTLLKVCTSIAAAYIILSNPLNSCDYLFLYVQSISLTEVSTRNLEKIKKSGCKVRPVGRAVNLYAIYYPFV
jgi:hypothetical protein